MDMLDIPGQYDCITANAVTYLFNHAEYEKAVASIARALRPNGAFISFDWYHAFEGQDVAITEFTAGHPTASSSMHVPIPACPISFAKPGSTGLPSSRFAYRSIFVNPKTRAAIPSPIP